MKDNQRGILEGLVREALQLGAEVVEVEHQNGVEEVVAYKGSLGRELARFQSGTADAAALRRELYACSTRPRRFGLEGDELVLQ